MKEHAGFLILLLSASVFLVILLSVVMFLPRLLKKKEPEKEGVEINTVMGAFSALGREIKSLKEQLIVKERLAALGEVSAGIAHELRNPMGVITGYAKLLLKGTGPSDERREIVQGILDEIGEMNCVIEELLKFSRSESLSKAEIDLAKTIRDVIRGLSDAAGWKIEFPFSEGYVVKADETLLKQAVKNLLQNALDAGDKVWVGLERGVAFDGEGVFIIVKDNGRGMRADELNRIFMPFYTTKSGGSGIGLALVQKIAVGHGGNVSVESREGKGSTFKLFVPLE